MNIAEVFEKYKKLIIGGAVVLLLIIIGVWWWSWANSVDNDGYERQRAVQTQYNAYQNELSTCLDKTLVGAQIATEEYDQVKNVLQSVVGARYGGDDAAALSGDAFVSVLVEQYPEIDRSLWKQLMTTALGCRDQVKGVNNELQALAGRFDTWSNTGGIFSKPLRNNYPTDELKVTGLNGILTGKDALDFIVTPITTGEAKNAILTQEMPDQELFPSDAPTE